MDKEEARKILGVSKNATPEEIKQARNKLALKHHADKGDSNAKIIKCNSGEKKINIIDSGLSQKLQQELKSIQEPITFNQVEGEFDKKKNGNAGMIAAIIIIGIVLTVVIGIVVHKNKKRDY